MTFTEMKPVLLLVDLQDDYLAAPALEPGRGEIVERAAALLRSCREHSIPVIHVWTTVSRECDRRMPHWKLADRWSCEAGTPGHAPPESLRPVAGETVVHKTFFSAFSSPELEPELRNRGAGAIIIAGVHLHACVRQTALDGYERGFEVWIAEDAVGSDDPVHAAITRRYLADRAMRFAAVAPMVAGLREAVGVPGPAADPAPARAAGQRARSAFRRLDDFPLEARGAMWERLAAALEGEATELAGQMAREIGKPVRYGRTEVVRTAELLRAVIRRCGENEMEPLAPGVLLRRRPHGVVALITPWNNPIYIALGKIAPAILCGNAVLWKPSPLARAVSRRLLELMLATGCPSGLVNLIEGGQDAAAALMADPEVDAVSLTGSSKAGFAAQEICARRRIPLQAELGGNNAAIVWWDCDLREAAQRIAEGAFGMAGQRCTANRRVIVHESIYDEFVGMVNDEAVALPSGDPLNPDTRVGPLVDAGQAARVAALIGRCAAEGHRIIEIAPRIFSPLTSEQLPAWRAPALVCCDDPAAEIVQQETFGPVLVVQRARHWEHAMELCNGVRQGLAAALFSRSVEVQQRFLDQARAGILKINQATADAAVDAPFGGWKSSGVGPPEHGCFDSEFYLRPQTCYVGPT